MTMKYPKAIRKCSEMMMEMLRLGFTKKDLPALEKLFWEIRDHRTGEIKKP